MTTKLVEMAVRDEKGKVTMGVEEVEIVRVNIRNRDPRSGGHVFNSVVCGEVKFKPGEVKTLEISEPEAAEIKRRRDSTWELTATPPSRGTEDEEDYEPTSSEASAMAAAAEEQLTGELPRSPRVQRWKLR